MNWFRFLGFCQSHDNELDRLNVLDRQIEETKEEIEALQKKGQELGGKLLAVGFQIEVVKREINQLGQRLEGE